MEEIFQKSAKSEREADLRRSGVLSAATFDNFSSLRAFLPSKELRSLVSHYWIVRWNIPKGMVYRPTEVLAGPAVNIFFMGDEAFLYGLTAQTFDYEAKEGGIMAGATFQPGGFYPFWGESMTTLPPHRSSLDRVFSGATPTFTRSLLAHSDDKKIAGGIETLMKQKKVVASPHLATVTSIFNEINYEHKFDSVKEVARHYRIPERTLQLLFRREVGMSLKRIIMRARMLEAVSAAHGQARPDWAMIAADLGYSSQAHFITDFKQATGQTLASFHKANQN